MNPSIGWFIFIEQLLLLCNFMSGTNVQQHKQNPMERDYFNKSNIDFTKFSQPPEDPQRNKIYTYSSQISQNLKEHSEFTQIQTRSYRNKIFHSAHKYQVPVYDYTRAGQTNPVYQEFYRTHRKFVKPYGQLTKHADTLNKNKQLIRRCHFDIPITVDIQKPQPKTSCSYMKTRRTTTRGTTRYEKPEILGTTTAAPRREDFDKTISNQYVVFRRLFEKERSGKSDRAELNNSMNRLLAAEMINLQISRTNAKSRSKTIEA